MKLTQSKAIVASRIGVFAALYATTSLVPISIFIGASSFLSLNLVITPTIAVLLSPIEAGCAALIGALLALWIAPHQAMFGPTTVLLPLVGAVCGSLVFRKIKLGALVSGFFLIGVVASYLVARGQFPYWIAPHALTIVLMGISSLMTPLRIRVVLGSFVATIFEQAAMLIQAVYVLQLPVIAFATAFPLMLYERIIATLGASLIVLGIAKFTPNYFDVLHQKGEKA